MDTNTKYKLTINVISWILILVLIQLSIIFLITYVFNFWFGFLFITLASDVLFLLFVLLQRHFTYFVFNEEKINIEYGILFKKSKTIHYKKLQNIVVSSGPVMRLAGLSRINFWTASPAQITTRRGNSRSNADLSIYLETENAELLEEFVTHWSE